MEIQITMPQDEPITADVVMGESSTIRANVETEIGSTNNHPDLLGRNLPEQHPISAITNLTESLSGLQNDIGNEVIARENGDSYVEGLVQAEEGRAVESEEAIEKKIDDHIADVNNPHQVTKTQIGLGNVDNTSDMDKPVSSAVQSALAGKVSDVKVNNVSVVTSNVANVDLSGYVTTNTGQTISGAKTFSNTLTMAGQTPIAASHNFNSYAVFQRLPNTREQIFSNGGDKVRFRGSETRPQYNGNDLALYSDISASAPTAGTGINITSGVVSVTAPTVINNATGANSIALGDSSQSTAEGSVALGKSSRANSTYSTAIGYSAYATNTNSVAIGKQSKATAARTVAIGSGAEANANDAYVIKGINNTANTFQVGTYTLLDTSTGLIPDARISSTWASKNYVDDSVSTNTAYFDGSWDTYADIPTTVAGFTNESLLEPTNNNYLVVLEDETQDGGTWRYKYVDDGLGYDKANWSVEYEVNETPFTQAQLDAINSGVTSADVALAQSALQSGDNISELVNDSGYISGITSSDVTTALGYTPYNSSNPSGYISGITSSDVTTALGYTPYDNSNPDGYITGITSGDVTTALGYTPYDASNPSGYTSNVGTVTSVNNTSPDGNGNVTLSIPAAQVNSDWNANSGVAEILNKPSLATVATSGAYSDLTGTPTIPTVNNSTITITQGGVTKGSFTLNQASGDTIALDSGGDSLPSQTGHTGDLLTTDGTNASWVDTETIYPVIETYQSGTSWYRVYSDGWVEQGGLSSSGTSVTVNLLKPYADTSYTIIGIKNRPAASSNPVSVSAVTTASATFATSGDGAPVYWEAKGYGA